MRASPSIIPDAVDRDVYLVLDDFRRLGRSWRETDEEDCDRATLVRALLEGQYNAPVQVICSTRPKAGRAMCRRKSPWR
jgi:uncharacterized protein YcbK (DUF882 family)